MPVAATLRAFSRGRPSAREGAPIVTFASSDRKAALPLPRRAAPRRPEFFAVSGAPSEIRRERPATLSEYADLF